MRKLILASASPRRMALLEQIDLHFTVIPADVDETLADGIDAHTAVETLARRKARQVFKRFPYACVLGADTVVEVDGKILGKPRDRLDAYAMLSSLRGRTHRVLTGLCLLCAEGEFCAVEETRVTFGDVEDERIIAYLETGEADDKAGAYAIQGRAAAWISGIEGCYFNVVGLPLFRVEQLLRQAREACSPGELKPSGDV